MAKYPYQAKHYRQLLNLTELNPRNNPYKPLCANKIVASEQQIQTVVGILESESFRHSPKWKLYYLSFGIQLKEQVHNLFGIWDIGKVLIDQFLDKKIFSKDLPFHQQIKQNKIPLFIPSSIKLLWRKKTKKWNWCKQKYHWEIVVIVS